MMHHYPSCMWAFFLLVTATLQTTPVAAKAAAFIKRDKSRYTPLLFFKVPMGQMVECEFALH